MESVSPLPAMLLQLWTKVSISRRRQYVALLVLLIFASFAEVLSIGSILPFLGGLTSPDKVFEHHFAKPFISVLHIETPSELLLPLTLAFGSVALLNGGMRLLLLWTTIRLCYLTGADLSMGMYQRTLYQPYALHVLRNSSEVINAISTKTGVTIHIIMMILNLVSSIVILVSILATLIVVDPKVACAAFSGFGVIYATVIGLTRKSLYENSRRVANETTLVIKSLQEGLGGIRDVLIDGSQATYCAIYRESDFRARLAQGNSGFIGASPRFAVEALAVLLIAGLAWFMAHQPGGITKTIPVLGALALGAQRMLPIMQQAYSSWTNIKSNQVSLKDALDLLNQPLPNWAGKPPPEPIPFTHQIELRNLSFRYTPNTPFVLENVNLRIPRGARIGFIGATGSGKSTLLDIIMGLLTPTSGQIEIDEQVVSDENCRAWQAHLAHVPQSVFLADASIEENIAFGVPPLKIDRKRVRLAAQQAQIAETIESWPENYKTTVGERGIRLSGGQRQRIGIARALYKKADVIIFDEATSALDNETERAVMAAIENLDQDLTILIIAHRTSTLSSCDQICELKGKNIMWSGSYQEIKDR